MGAVRLRMDKERVGSEGGGWKGGGGNAGREGGRTNRLEWGREDPGVEMRGQGGEGETTGGK